MNRWKVASVAAAWVVAAACLARPALAAEDWGSVVPRLRAQWVANPDDPEIQRQLAVALHNHAVDLAAQGQWDLAVFHGEEALSLAPGDRVIRRDLAQLYVNRGVAVYNVVNAGKGRPNRGEGPATYARKAINVDPSLAGAHLLLGDARYGEGATGGAKLAWEKARRLDPDLPGLDRRFALLDRGASGAGGVHADACDPRAWADRVQRRRAAFRRAPAEPRHRTLLAEALHGYGACLATKRRWEDAVSNLVAAARLAPDDLRLKQDLGAAYLGQAQETYTSLKAGHANGRNEQFLGTVLQQAIEADPASAAAHLLLGDVAYEHQRLEDARQAWQRARELDPALPGIDARLARLAREFDAEAGMDLVSDAHFILQYEEDVSASMSYDVRGKLALARQEVGQRFGYWPERRIVVLLYAVNTYRSVKRGAPQWSGGLYDGKIRIPVRQGMEDAGLLERVIFHEYAHAVIHEITGGNCPLWLNEGLAETVSVGRAGYDPLPQVRKAAAAGGVLPWNRLDRAFRSLSVEAAHLAYDQSHSIVSYLSKTYGFWRVQRVLDSLGKGQAATSAIEEEFGISIASLEQGWRRWVVKTR